MTKKTDKQTRRKAKTASKTASKAASENAQLDRRSFMRLAGLGAGVAGASIGLGASEASASEQASAAQGGYRETDHVKTYYRMASF